MQYICDLISRGRRVKTIGVESQSQVWFLVGEKRTESMRVMHHREKKKIYYSLDGIA